MLGLEAPRHDVEQRLGLNGEQRARARSVAREIVDGFAIARVGEDGRDRVLVLFEVDNGNWHVGERRNHEPADAVDPDLELARLPRQGAQRAACKRVDTEQAVADQGLDPAGHGGGSGGGVAHAIVLQRNGVPSLPAVCTIQSR